VSDRFNACLAELFGHEGGYSNRSLRDDPGGATNLGVTHATYDAWRRAKGLPIRDVRKITTAEATEIYREWYWDAVRSDDLPIGLDICAFDFCVNSGAGRATREMQAVLGVHVDGHMGIQTIEAAKRCDVPRTIRAYVGARRKFGRRLKNYRANPGWEPRWDRVEASALAAAAGSAPIETATALSATQQAAVTGKAVDEPVKPPVKTEVAAGAAGATGTVTGVASAIGKIGKKAEPTHLDVILAFLSEPMFLMALISFATMFSTYLWRKKHAQ
jgi:lysozyme family protein